MQKFVWTAMIVFSGVIAASPAYAIRCADGVYRTVCTGPNGAAAVRKAPVYRKPTVKCANGVYRAGCAGPNGAAVVRKPY